MKMETWGKNTFIRPKNSVVFLALQKISNDPRLRVLQQNRKYFRWRQIKQIPQYFLQI